MAVQKTQIYCRSYICTPQLAVWTVHIQYTVHSYCMYLGISHRPLLYPFFLSWNVDTVQNPRRHVLLTKAKPMRTICTQICRESCLLPSRVVILVYMYIYIFFDQLVNHTVCVIQGFQFSSTNLFREIRNMTKETPVSCFAYLGQTENLSNSSWNHFTKKK